MHEVYRVLKPGGVYVCVTPNRLGGPYDISRHFDTVATGLHLKEYTVTDSSDLFRRVGFGRIRDYVGARGLYVRPPLTVLRAFEAVLETLRTDSDKGMRSFPLARHDDPTCGDEGLRNL